MRRPPDEFTVIRWMYNVYKGVERLSVREYYQPVSLLEALKRMRCNGLVKVLAGGTDLIITLREKKLNPERIVDLSLIEELKKISLDDSLHIGSMVTFSELENNKYVKEVCPVLADAASRVGSPQIRNKGTLGGNLANGATAADTVPVLMALDAVAVIRSESGTRYVPVKEIPSGLNTTCLKEDELICDFIIPLHNDYFMDFEKVGRRKALAISRINMAIVLKKEGEVINDVEIAFGAVGLTAYRSFKLEKFLKGKVLDEKLIHDACEMTEVIIAEKLHGRITTPYKKKIGAAVLRRALGKAMGGASVR